MQVFISWSGETSRALALILKDCLSIVVQQSNPWMSDTDIDPGMRWSRELAQILESSDFGIACVTPDNLSSPWLLFESGALAKSVEFGRLVPVLVNLDPIQLPPPLSQFQALKPCKEDLLKLVLTIRKSPPANNVSEEITRAAFDALWPTLESRLQSLPQPQKEIEQRNSGSVINEILTITRRLDQEMADSSPKITEPKVNEILSWLISEVHEIEATMVKYETSLKFYNERSANIPESLEDQHRSLRYRLQFLTDARNAISSLLQYSDG